MSDFRFIRVVPGRYYAALGGTRVKATVVYIKGIGWFIAFTDGAHHLVRTRVEAKAACLAYLTTGFLPEGSPPDTAPV